MSSELRSEVEKLDIEQLVKNPEKLHRLKQNILQSFDELEAGRSEQCIAKSTIPESVSGLETHWPGRLWVPAETSYPTDDVGRPSCLRETHVEILVYDCKTDKGEVIRGLQQLYTKKALVTKLPSRFAGELTVCIEQMPPTAMRRTPRYRITERQVPKDMASRHLVRLRAFSPLTRCKIFLGRIKWIFILNATKELSDATDKS